MREEGVRIKERERERTMYMNVWPFCLFRLSQKRNKKKKYKEKYGEKFNSLDTLANEREKEKMCNFMLNFSHHSILLS